MEGDPWSEPAQGQGVLHLKIPDIGLQKKKQISWR